MGLYYIYRLFNSLRCSSIKAMIIAAAIERMGMFVLALAHSNSTCFLTSDGTQMASPCPFTPVYNSRFSLNTLKPLTVLVPEPVCSSTLSLVTSATISARLFPVPFVIKGFFEFFFSFAMMMNYFFFLISLMIASKGSSSVMY